MAVENVNDKLNPKLWKNEEIVPAVKEKLLQIANNFVENIKEDEIELKLKDIIIVGSNANYNYTDESDIDLHLIADMSGVEDEEEKRLLLILYNAYKTLFNKKYDINIKGHEVEVYVESEETNTQSEGVFSLYNGWIKAPSSETFENDKIDAEFDVEFKKWEDRFNKLMSDEEINIGEDFESSKTLTVYKGSQSSKEDFTTVDLMESTEIGIHCETKSAVKSLGYKHIYEIKLGNFNLLEFDFDMNSDWAVPELANKLSEDEIEVKRLLTKLRTVSHRRDKKEQYSKIFRDFILAKGYNLISYKNEDEDINSVSYIIIDTSTIIDAKLIEEENLSSAETNKLNEIETFMHDLLKLRKTSLAKDGENSVGNRVFKQFRRLGYIKALKDAKTAYEQKEMSLESLYEALEGISDEELFWNLRDGLVDDSGEFIEKTDYSVSAKNILDTLEGNLYLNESSIDILLNPDNMFAVSPEQYPKHLLNRDSLLKFKDVVEGEIVMFYNSTDEYGSEYSVLTSHEDLAIKACKGEFGTEFAKQRAYAKYIKGEYNEVVVNDTI